MSVGENLAASQPASQPASHLIGIPIGNLTSQFFANIYLNGLDHFIKEKLGCKFYLRYMDDFVIFHKDKSFLWFVKEEVIKYLKQFLQLSLHQNKCRIYKATAGVPFLGLLISPHHRRLKRTNLVRFKRRLRKFQKLYKERLIAWPHINQSIQSWIGHASHADSASIRKLLLEETIFQ